MQPDLSHLPSSAQRLIEVIGLILTLRLINKHGGKTMRLYATGAGIEQIAEAIGTDGANKLFEYFECDPFTIPLCEKALKRVRNEKIIAEFDRLTSVEKLSGRKAVQRITEHFKITDRTIWLILKKSGAPALSQSPVDPRQLSLL